MSDENDEYEFSEEEALQFANVEIENDRFDIESHQREVSKYNKIAKRYAQKLGEPDTDVTEIFEKTAEEAASENVSVSESAKEDSGPTGTGSPESTELLNNIYKMAGTQFVQMFYDLYMSPLNSDIEYRLGQVTGTKVNFQNIGKFKKGFNGAQFDKFGRIDTTSNFKMRTHIDGIDDGSILGYDEYFVNWFFPPYNQSAFKINSTINEIAEKDLTQRKWNASHQCWEINGEEDTTTYDVINMMSCRPNPTYRKTAFKAVNDNIQWLQKIYENTTGIVSTYLTEWDLSLYIQEGLLEDAKKYPVINMCYRIMDDNPMGWHDTRAFSFGLLNSALSKTPINGIVPNTLDWKPEEYPLSAYWTELDSVDRGDGLDIFYDVALSGWRSTSLKSFGYKENTFDRLDTQGKVKFTDDVNAAYSGWTTYKGMKTFQVLYSSPDDGLNQIDLAHLTEPIRSSKKGLTLTTAVNSVIKANYEIDDSLGYEQEEPTTIEDGNPKKLLGFRNRWVYRKKNWITGEYEECGARITPRFSKFTLYWQKPKKGLIFTPKWVPYPWKPFGGRYKSALDIGAVNDMYGSVDPENVSGNANTIGNNPALRRSQNGFYQVPDVDTTSFADHFGVSQKSPAMYGGPHGKYLSPKTIQAYFEEDNIFLKDVPRVDKEYEKSTDFKKHFTRNNNYYSYVCDEDVKVNPSRSPSYALSLLGKGAKTSTEFYSDIFAFWEINKVKIKSTTILGQKTSRWNWLLQGIINYFSPWSSRYNVAVDSKDSYRLQIIRGLITQKTETTKNGVFASTNITKQIISQGEQEFVMNVFNLEKGKYGNGKELKTGWKNVYFFQNSSWEERKNAGPNVIFQVPVRVNSYKYTKTRFGPWNWIHYIFGWTGLFNWWTPSWETAYANYIEVDCDHIYSTHNSQFWPTWTAINKSTSIFSNIGTTGEITSDVPSDEYRTNVASTPWAFEENASNSSFAFVQDFLGKSKDSTEKSIFGWGLTTAFQTIDGTGNFKVEGQNGKENGDTPIVDLRFKFYKNGKASNADDALNRTLQNLYTTSTFYKQAENENNYSRPCIVQNDVPFRVAVKNALHQLAWLRQAKDSFIDNVDFGEIKNIMSTMVEPAILTASTSGKKDDVHYSYWIEKANKAFSQDKAIWADKFKEIIEAYENFIDSMKGLTGKSALSWTFNEFDKAYSILSKIGKLNEDISEYMTAYLHVLYEYRKYFLNMRFNKTGGTMTSMKYLESTIPLMVNVKETPESAKLNSVDTLPANFGNAEYPVGMYEVSNSNTDKLNAASGQSAPLKKDKTTTLYIKVEYANDEEVAEYIEKLRKGEESEQHLMYVPNNGKWAKLNQDGIFQFVSKEWERNKANKVWNLTCNEGDERFINEDITDCLFSIVWCKKSDTLAYTVLKNIDTSLAGEKERNAYIIPYVYEELQNAEVPTIRFGITSGLNMTKLSDVANAMQTSNASAMDLICTTRDTEDYFKIEIPFSEQPLTSGYKTKLKIKTYLEEPAISIAQETLAGPMTFTIWPITEDQVDVTPGIGVNMTKQAGELRKTRTSIDVGGN